MNKCLSGKINNALVPAITYCQLKITVDNVQTNLGHYINGFWLQDNISRLPFLKQSYIGVYISPMLNNNL